MKSKPIELVIFDCDGVLVDSEMISSRVLSDIFEEIGITLSPAAVYEKFRGGSMNNTLQYVEDQLKTPIPIDLENEYRKRSFIAYRNEMKAVDGIENILSSLKVKKCVGSNGPQSKIKINLEVTGLSQYFHNDHIHSAYDIQKWKPLPDLYLYAAELHRVNPAHCLVVEDSIHGAQAAQAAGMRCLGYAADTAPADFHAVKAIAINHMSDIDTHFPELF